MIPIELAVIGIVFVWLATFIYFHGRVIVEPKRDELVNFIEAYKSEIGYRWDLFSEAMMNDLGMSLENTVYRFLALETIDHVPSQFRKWVIIIGHRKIVLEGMKKGQSWKRFHHRQVLDAVDHLQSLDGAVPKRLAPMKKLPRSLII